MSYHSHKNKKMRESGWGCPRSTDPRQLFLHQGARPRPSRARRGSLSNLRLATSAWPSWPRNERIVAVPRRLWRGLELALGHSAALAMA